MDRLPLEVVRHLVTFLDWKSRFKMVQVNRTFHMVLTDEKWENGMELVMAKVSVPVAFHSGLVSEGHRGFLKTLSHTKHIRLLWLRNVEAMQVAQFLGYLKRAAVDIGSIRLDPPLNLNSSQQMVQISQCLGESLRCLELSNCTLTNGLLYGFNKLESLVLGDNLACSHFDFKLPSTLRKLRLNCARCSIENNYFEKIGLCEAMRELEIVHLRQNTSDSAYYKNNLVRISESMPNLEALTLEKCSFPRYLPPYSQSREKRPKFPKLRLVALLKDRFTPDMNFPVLFLRYILDDDQKPLLKFTCHADYIFFFLTENLFPHMGRRGMSLDLMLKEIPSLNVIRPCSSLPLILRKIHFGCVCDAQPHTLKQDGDVERFFNAGLRFECLRAITLNDEYSCSKSAFNSIMRHCLKLERLTISSWKEGQHMSTGDLVAIYVSNVEEREAPRLRISMRHLPEEQMFAAVKHTNLFSEKTWLYPKLHFKGKYRLEARFSRYPPQWLTIQNYITSDADDCLHYEKELNNAKVQISKKGEHPHTVHDTLSSFQRLY